MGLDGLLVVGFGIGLGLEGSNMWPRPGDAMMGLVGPRSSAHNNNNGYNYKLLFGLFQSKIFTAQNWVFVIGTQAALLIGFP